MRLLAAAAALFCAQLTTAMYSSSDPVHVLTAANFDKVTSSPGVWIVEFYAPWCGHCQRLTPVYKKVAKKLKGVVGVAAIDCDDASNQPVCGRYGVRGFPTIKLFPAGKQKNPTDYQGPREMKPMVDYALSQLPSKQIKSITNEAGLTAFLDKKTAIRALLITDKKDTAPLYKSISLDYKGKVSFAEIKQKPAFAVDRFSLTSFPAFMVFPIDAEEPVAFNGEKFDSDSLRKFLSGITGDKGDDKGKSSSKSKAKKEAPKLVVEVLPVLISSWSEFKEHCYDPSSSSNALLCVTAFLLPVDDEYPSTAEDRNAHVKELGAAKIQNARIVYMDGTTALGEALIDATGAASSLPSIAAIQVRKNVASAMTSAFEGPKIKEFVDNMRTGNARLWNLRDGFEKKMLAAITADEPSSTGSSDSDESAGKNATDASCDKEEMCTAPSSTGSSDSDESAGKNATDASCDKEEKCTAPSPMEEPASVEHDEL